MTTHRLMDGVSGRPGNGPAAATSYSGDFQAGLAFEVTDSGIWFEGYWWWVCETGQTTTAQTFVLWELTGPEGGVLVPGTTVTSGTLAAGQWNYVPLTAPVMLTAALAYVAATAFASTGFPCTNNQFGSGDPYADGISNGPLTAYSDNGASRPVPDNWLAQGSFGTATTDPAKLIPYSGSGSANFWVDVQVSDTAPSGASYRLWPGYPEPLGWVQDSALNFTIATEFTLSQSCTLNHIWFYSLPGTSQLPTACGIWDVSTQTLVQGTLSSPPLWSGAAGGGWVSCAYSGITLPRGDYQVAVGNGAASPVMWNAATLNYWSTGPGAGGIKVGPLSAPDLASATGPGQGTYHQGTSFVYPDTYDTGGAPSYWVDVEITPAAPPPPPPSASQGGFLPFF